MTRRHAQPASEAGRSAISRRSVPLGRRREPSTPAAGPLFRDPAPLRLIKTPAHRPMVDTPSHEQRGGVAHRSHPRLRAGTPPRSRLRVPWWPLRHRPRRLPRDAAAGQLQPMVLSQGPSPSGICGCREDEHRFSSIADDPIAIPKPTHVLGTLQTLANDRTQRIVFSGRLLQTARMPVCDTGGRFGIRQLLGRQRPPCAQGFLADEGHPFFRGVLDPGQSARSSSRGNTGAMCNASRQRLYLRRG